MNLPPELLFDMLLDMDLAPMMRLCGSTPELYNFCQDESLWRIKVQRQYGVAQYVPNGMTHQEQYKSLYLLPPLDDAIVKGRLDQIIVWRQRGAVVNPDNLSAAVEHGHINILDYFARQNILPTIESYFWAILMGNIDLLNWLWNHGLMPNNNDALGGVEINSIDVLLWLESHGVELGEWTANAVPENVKVLDWLEKERRLLPTYQGANFASFKGNIEILEWMADRGIYPTEDGMYRAAEEGHLNVIEWMVSRLGMKPSGIVANAAVSAGNSIEILNYLEKLGIIPDDYMADQLIIWNNPLMFETLDWLWKHNIRPTLRGIYNAIRLNRVDILQWIVDHDIKPTVSWANQAARGNNVKVLEWLDSQGIKPKKL